MANAKDIIDLLKSINDALKSTDTTSKIVKDTQKQVAKAFNRSLEKGRIGFGRC